MLPGKQNVVQCGPCMTGCAEKIAATAAVGPAETFASVSVDAAGFGPAAVVSDSGPATSLSMANA